MQFESELAETLPQFFQESLGIRAVLEANHEVVSVAHQDHVPSSVSPTPVVGP